MKFRTFTNALIIIGSLAVFVLAGCSNGGGATANMALDMQPGQSANYRVISEKSRSVEFGGSLEADESFQGGERKTLVEMLFTQQIEQVDEQGNATAKITILDVKASSHMRDEVVTDFDSDQGGVFAQLVGLSYTIKIAPTGQVVEVVDATPARRAIREQSPQARQARLLLSDDEIIERHTVSILPNDQLSIGQNWQSVKTFSFGMLGTKELERIYTLDRIDTEAGKQVAVAQLSAIPSAQEAHMLHQQAMASGFDSMLDTSHDYSGTVKLDIQSGRFLSCVEDLRAEWVIVEPASGDDEMPGMLKMSARIYSSLEKVD